MKKKDEVVEIDLWKLVLACLNRAWLIFLATVIFGTASFMFTKACVTPQYQSTVKIYVNNSDISVGNISISASDLTASIKLVEIYNVILNTKDTLDKVIEEAELDYDYEQLMSMLSTSAVDDTQVFKVTVTNKSPEEAQLIASTIGKVLPDVITTIIESADARIVEHAIVPTHRSSPSYSKNSLMGAFAGFVLSVVAICIAELTDTKIKNEEELLEIIDIPILTYIPDFNDGDKKSSHYKKNYYYRKDGSRGEA